MGGSRSTRAATRSTARGMTWSCHPSRRRSRSRSPRAASAAGVRRGRPVADPAPRLYSEFASWFHLLTAPAEYAGEAAFYRQALIAASASPLRTLLELGSGG